jgi:hypothetical protein
MTSLASLPTTVHTAVTDTESKVVEAVRDLQTPVVEYVQKGVDLAEDRLPKVSYPTDLPKPGDVIDSQYEFVTSLLAAQYDLVKAVASTVAPLVGVTVAKPSAKATKSTKATKKAA